MAAGWTDERGGLRACRTMLAEWYPSLTSKALAGAFGFDPAWYSRVESGKAGLTVPNLAKLGGGILGLLQATFPERVWTLHDIIPDVLAPTRLPDLPPLPTEPNTFTWRIAPLRDELGQAQQRRGPISIPELTAALGLQHMVLYDIEKRKSPGSIPTLIKLYDYFSRHLARPLLLDHILTIARYVPADLAPLVSLQPSLAVAGY